MPSVWTEEVPFNVSMGSLVSVVLFAVCPVVSRGVSGVVHPVSRNTKHSEG